LPILLLILFPAAPLDERHLPGELVGLSWVSVHDSVCSIATGLLVGESTYTLAWIL
jgi:hypothetical protein